MYRYTHNIKLLCYVGRYNTGSAYFGITWPCVRCVKLSLLIEQEKVKNIKPDYVKTWSKL